MNLKVYKDYKEMSLQAALLLKNIINQTNKLITGLPAGKTPLGFYEELVQMFKRGEVSFANTFAFGLDEYLDFNYNNKDSFSYFLIKKFFSLTDFPEENISFPVANQKNHRSICKEYEQKIKSLGGLDIVFLGLGINGHIAFNEPGSSLLSKTRVIKLTPETKNYNKNNFINKNNLPDYGVTMGIETIMRSRTCVLLVSGENKAETLKKALTGKITKEVPASFLQKHKNLMVLADKAATSLIKSGTVTSKSS